MMIQKFEVTKKDLEYTLRLHGIEGEDAFYLITFLYCNQLNSIPLRDKTIFEKTKKSHHKISSDQHLTNLFVKLINEDPQGNNIPIWYQHFLGRKFREDSGKFFTPRPIAKAMASLFPIRPGAIIMDPACGSATFLQEISKKWGNLPCTLIANDVETSLVHLSHIVLELSTPKNHEKIFNNSNIFEPNQSFEKWYDKIDYVIANPPFSLPIKSIKIPTKLYSMGYKNSDAVFLDVCYNLLKPGGRLVTLLPHSIISNKEYKKLRETVEKSWSLLGVIELPEHTFNLTSNTTTRADIVILEKKNDKKQKKSFFAYMPEIGIPKKKNGNETAMDKLASLVNNTDIQKILKIKKS